MNRIAPMSELRQREPRIEDRAHLAWIPRLFCVICGRDRPVAAHVRYADARYNKPITGAGTKPDDRFTVPLCDHCHTHGPDCQHASGERQWWEDRHIDPLNLGNRLYEVSGDTFEGMVILREFQHEAYLAASGGAEP